MTGGPWTRSMKVVHGPGPKWGSMDPWSMFCPHPGRPAQLTFEAGVGGSVISGQKLSRRTEIHGV